ncbi:MAG: type II toxin-antitoxin system VapC family toxin [Sphingomonas sp.]|nr:type II toxin-antitoxin system VapC family toxin [Sphingomonas sp.]
MQAILDTHALIWWWANDPRLANGMRALIEDKETTVFVSAISALEIAIKVRLGKLPEMQAHIDQFHEAVRDEGFIHLNLDHRHAVTAGLLSGEHRDPFDRAIAAQGLVETLPIITHDRAFSDFGCKVLW